MLHDYISHRKSTVLFSPEPIYGDVINELFEAARWAPSSMNAQPWRFVYALKKDPWFDTMLACLDAKNQEWAKNAPMLMLTCAEVIFEHNNRENIYAWHDTGMAYANFVFQATSLGLSVHPMGGFNRELAREAVQLPANIAPVAMVAIGYKSDSTDFAPHLMNKENRQRVRKPLVEIVFQGRFGNQA
jgi:nitroreductase